MDWRILAVALPLLGFLQVPEVSANFDLTFTIQETFLADYSNSSLNATKLLNKALTTQIDSIYQAKYSGNFFGLLIQQFRNNSGVVVNGLLQFYVYYHPSVAELTQVFLNGLTNKNVTIPISNTSISIVDLSPPVTPSPTVSFGFSASIAAIFLPAFANLSNPSTVAFINNITTQVNAVFSKIFPSFITMTVSSLSNGSVIVNGALVFNNTGTIPSYWSLLNIVNAAITSGNFTFGINSITFAGITITITTPPTTTTTTTPTTTPTVPMSFFNLNFSIVDTFNSSLSNLSSAQAVALTSKVTTQIGSVYQKAYSNFKNMTVLSYRNGSIVTNGTLFFFSNGSIPSVKSLLATLLSAIANNTLGFTINPQSIIITDSSGTFASGSPVMATMFTALWMTLMSLLLSAVMHY